MWRKIGIAVLCCGSLLAEQADAGACVVMNSTTGKVILQKMAHKKMFPASTTKIATVAFVLENPQVDLEQKIVVPLEAVRAVGDVEKSKDKYTKYPSYILEAGSSIAGLKTGEIVSIKDVLYGALLPSGNDAANTLAYYWGGGSIDAFMGKLNAYLESLGCQHTSFKNPHGLHHPEHVTTAYDLALMARHAMELPCFRTIVGSKSYTKLATNKQPEVLFAQTNKLIADGPFFCEWATGVKTGHHRLAGHCIVASGESNGRSIVLVLLNCPDRKQMFVMAKQLLTRFLSEKKQSKQVVTKGPVALQRDFEGHSQPVSLEAAESCSVEFYASEEPAVQAMVEWMDVSCPIKKGQPIGSLRVLLDTKEVARVPLLSLEDRRATWQQRLIQTQRVLQHHRGMASLIFVAVITLFIVALARRRSRQYR